MMLTILDEFPDHITSFLRSSDNLFILGDFNIPWNKPEDPDTISIQGILDMCELNQHIYTQTNTLGNTTDWLKGNTTNNFQKITSKDYVSDHSLTEWKFKIISEPIDRT